MASIMKRNRSLPLVLAPLVAGSLCASGCSSRDEALYPSLAPRPIEKLVAREMANPSTAAAAAAQTPLDPGLTERMQGLTANVDAAGNALDAAIAETGPASPGAQPGSEQWADNQIVLSRLGSALANLRGAEADLGALQSDVARARVGGAATASADSELAALQKRIDALIARGEAAAASRR